MKYFRLALLLMGLMALAVHYCVDHPEVRTLVSLTIFCCTVGLLALGCDHDDRT